MALTEEEKARMRELSGMPPAAPAEPSPDDWNPDDEIARIRNLRKPKEEEKGFFSKALDTVKGAAQRFGEGFSEQQDKATESWRDTIDKSGEVSKTRTTLDAIGSFAKGAVSPVRGLEKAFEPVIEPVKEYAGKKLDEASKTPIGRYFDKAQDQSQEDFFATPGGQEVKAKMTEFLEFAKKPENQKTIGGLMDAAEVVGYFLGGGLAKKPISEGIDMASDLAKKTAQKTGEVVEGVKKEMDNVFQEAVKRQSLEKETDFLSGLSPNKPKEVSKLQKTSDQMTGNVNRILPERSQEFERMTGGKSHGQWLNERGINKTPSENIETLGNKFLKEKNALDSAISQVPGLHNPKSVAPILDEALEWAVNTSDTGGQRLLNGIKTKLEKQGGLLAKDIIDLKRYYEKNNKFAYSKEMVASGKIERATNLDNVLREDLIDIAEKAGFKEFRALSKEIQQTKYLVNEIAKAQSRMDSKDVFDITDRMLGSGAVMEPMLLMGIAAKKFWTGATFKSAVARALNSLKIKPLTIESFPRLRQRAEQLEAQQKASAKQIKSEKSSAQKKALEVEELDKKGVGVGEGFQFKKQEPLTREAQDAARRAEKEAQEAAKLAENKAYQQEQALIVDELAKKGIKMGDGFQFVDQMPLTRQEQLLIQAASNKEEARRIAIFIVQERAKGNAVGEGFTITNIDNTPILDPVNPEFPVGSASSNKLKERTQ
jgi:hypothetical protein